MRNASHHKTEIGVLEGMAMESVMWKLSNFFGTRRLPKLPHILLRSLLIIVCLLGMIAVKSVHATVFGIASASCRGPFTDVQSLLDTNATVSEVTASIVSGTCPNPNPVGTFGTADARASADQTSGQLKILAMADGNTQAFARAGFGDVITVIPTSGFSDPTFQVTEQLEISGSVSGNADAGGILQLFSSIGNITVNGDVICTAVPAVCSPLSQTPAGDMHQILTATIDVAMDSPRVFLQDQLFAAVNCINSTCLSTQTGESDFSHTAQLSLILPAGFTFTSDSGVLLINAPTAPGPITVPEPSTLPLFIAGLLGLVRITVGRRRALQYL